MDLVTWKRIFNIIFKYLRPDRVTIKDLTYDEAYVKALRTGAAIATYYQNGYEKS